MFYHTQQQALWLTTLLVAMWTFGFSSSTSANIDIGRDWLANQAQAQGPYSTASDLATPFVATAETLQTLYQLGETTSSQPSMADALDFINAQEFPNTEHLSRMLMVNLTANSMKDVTDWSNALVARLNGAGGGMGDFINYNGMVVDTAWALAALARTDIINTATEALYPAIDFLLTQQHENGGWAYHHNNTSVSATAIVMHALWPYRHVLSNIPSLNVVTATDKAQDYLLAQRNGEGLWDETFDSALACLILVRYKLSGAIS
jgi:hypothetical protein